MARSEYHHGDLRRALLEAAERLVVREGAARASLRAIAREAGVSPAAPYHHFEDRESLLAAVAASGFEGLRTAMAEGAKASAGEDPLGRLQASGIAYVGFAVENPEIYRLMFSGFLADRARFPRLESAADGAFAVLEGLLGAGAGDRDEGGPEADGRPGGGAGPGEGGGGGAAPPEVALAAWSMVHGLALLLIEGIPRGRAEEMGVEEITRRVTRVLGRGLGAYVGPGAS